MTSVFKTQFSRLVKNQRFAALFLIGFVVFFSQKSFSQEVIDTNFSVKDLGRGGVHLIQENDANVMYYNPAALAYITGVRWSMMGLQAGMGDPTTNLPLVQNNPIGPATINQYYGKNIWGGLKGGSTIAAPYFGAGLIGNYYLDFIASNPALPQVDVTQFIDYGLVLGAAVPMGPSFSAGMNLKRLTRTGGVATIGSAQIASLNIAAIQNAVTNTGSGYGVDLGVLWKPPNPVNFAVSLGWTDVGYTSFNASSGATAPPPIPDNMVLGMTMQQKITGFGWAAGLEYRHIRNDPIDITKKLHAGAEVNLGILDVRGGWYQGWYSYGATIDLWFLDLDLAKYTVERGAYAGQQGEDRYQIGLSFEAGFDPNFNFLGLGGKNHRLKVRR